MGWRSKAEKAKKEHRPSLKDWACDELYKTFPTYKEEVLARTNFGYDECIPFPNQTKKRSYHYSTEGGSSTAVLGCEIPARIDAKITPPSEFHSKYEAKLIPTVITNIPQGFDVPPPPPTPPSKHGKPPSPTSSSSPSPSPSSHYHHSKTRTMHAWKALDHWSIDTLASHDELRERLFKCGEDDDGKSIKLKLKHFIRYLENNQDDSPLYIFDSSFEDDRHAKRLLDDYRVPTYFNEDLFHLVGEKRRPPYRWFLIGPERSGTCVHIDPLATSAWNTLLVGKKRWVLFPPHVPKSIAKGSKYVYKNEDDEAIHYFTTILPRIKKAAKESDGTGKYEDFECYEFTQLPNETVYIPNGWWHAVLNLTDTVGVTQNFCSQRNFDQVWVKTRTGRKKMAYKWLIKLEEHYPHLAERAKELNQRDLFVMKYDPVEVEKRRVAEEKWKREKRLAKKNKEKASFVMDDGGSRNSSSQTSMANDVAFSRDAKRSRVERVVSP